MTIEIIDILKQLFSSIFKKRNLQNSNNNQQNNLSKVNNITNINIDNINIIMSKNTPSDIYKNKVILNLQEIKDKSDVVLVKQIIRKVYDNKDLIISTKSNDKLNRLKEYYSSFTSSDDKKITSFFKKILSKDDFDILESALFLRSEFIKHKNISNIKKDIVNSFGSRGARICNLCTAGYFDGFLQNLYHSDPVHFLKHFQNIVDGEVLAVFVNIHMDVSELKKTIERKIKSTKNARFDSLYVHGLGYENIKNIKDFINKYKNKFNFDDQNIVDNSEYNVYMVRIILN